MSEQRSATGPRSRSAWTVARIGGVPIRLDVSWLLVAALVTWIFFRSFSSLLADEGSRVVAIAAAAAALLFFASILAHELGHALASLARGIKVVGITLFLFGGVTESATEAQRARDEFVIVGIGPFISLVLAAAFALLHTAVAASRPVAAVVGYLAWFNLALAVFNTIPGYPLDGGRLLRSILWMATGKPHRSTRWAARVGQVFAFALIGYGVLLFLTGAGRGLNGLWEVMIGFFLYRGAADSYRRAVVRERLATQRAVDVMGSVPPALDPRASLADAIAAMQERPSLLWPVGDPVVGFLRLEDIDAVPADRWTSTTVGDTAHPLAGVVVTHDTPMDVALDQMARAPANQVLVTDTGGRPIGLLTPSLVSTLLQ